MGSCLAVIFQNDPLENELILYNLTGPKAGEYLTHCVVPGRGTGVELADLTYAVLEEYESLATLEVFDYNANFTFFL